MSKYLPNVYDYSHTFTHGLFLPTTYRRWVEHTATPPIHITDGWGYITDCRKTLDPHNRIEGCCYYAIVHARESIIFPTYTNYREDPTGQNKGEWDTNQILITKCLEGQRNFYADNEWCGSGSGELFENTEYQKNSSSLPYRNVRDFLTLDKSPQLRLLNPIYIKFKACRLDMKWDKRYYYIIEEAHTDLLPAWGDYQNRVLVHTLADLVDEYELNKKGEEQ